MEDEPALVRKLHELGLLVDKRIPDWYLPLLHFGFPRETQEEFFDRFRKLAMAVRDDDQFISALILDRNWRPTLVGTALAILLRKSDLQSDMIWRIANESWVGPQLAVGVAILDRGSGETSLIRHLNEATESSNPKSILSLYSALKFVESPAAAEFESSPLFRFFVEKDAWDGTVNIARENWKHWSSVNPIE